MTSEEPVVQRISVTLEKTTLHLLDDDANKHFMGNRSVALNNALKCFYGEFDNK